MFISFVEVERITGKVLGTTILQCLESWGLVPSALRGQFCDGGSNMAAVRSGCRAVVQAQAPKVIYAHSAAHGLNLAVVSACKIQEFQNTELCMGEIATFFILSAKRQRFLEKAVDATFPKFQAKNWKMRAETVGFSALIHVLLWSSWSSSLLCTWVFKSLFLQDSLSVWVQQIGAGIRKRLLKLMAFCINWSLLPFNSALQSYYMFYHASDE